VNLKNAPESRNFEDRTNYISRLSPSLADIITRNSLTGFPPPVISYEKLTPQERNLVDHGGLSLADILLMRATQTTPNQIRRGWNLQPE
jgi:hypothetical protein